VTLASLFAVLDVTPLERLGVGFALFLLFALALLLPSWARRLLLRQPVIFLVVYVALRLGEALVPEGTPARRFVAFAALAMLLASIGRSLVILVLDVIFGRRMASPLPRIIRDIAQGLVYVAVLLTALRAAGVEPGSILTTSALLTAAIALSLQETLGNMVAGLAIQAQRPFDVGDWIQFDAEQKHIGRVIEINWRATKIVTLDEVEVIIPNATLAKAPITNFTKPTLASRRSLYVSVSAATPPHDVQRLILEALDGSFGVLREPPPSVVTNAFVDGNVEYWVRFFTDMFHRRDGVDGAARDRIWYALGRAGITVAAPGRAVQLKEESAEARAHDEAAQTRRREEALKKVDFLAVLEDEQRLRLAASSQHRLYAAGEAIVIQGEASAEMFIVESGEVVVVRARAHGEQVVARLGPGKFFGEMALMTGESRRATVRAVTPCRLLVVRHAAFKAVLDSAPEVAEHVSRVIAERQSELADRDEEEPFESGPKSVEERSSQLLGRIRRFFAM
jgi:small-conductance mechanosensitive channel/CRP-like cAMP-binding protein